MQPRAWPPPALCSRSLSDAPAGRRAHPRPVSPAPARTECEPRWVPAGRKQTGRACRTHAEQRPVQERAHPGRRRPHPPTRAGPPNPSRAPRRLLCTGKVCMGLRVLHPVGRVSDLQQPGGGRRGLGWPGQTLTDTHAYLQHTHHTHTCPTHTYTLHMHHKPQICTCNVHPSHTPTIHMHTCHTHTHTLHAHHTHKDTHHGHTHHTCTCARAAGQAPTFLWDIPTQGLRLAAPKTLQEETPSLAQIHCLNRYLARIPTGSFGPESSLRRDLELTGRLPSAGTSRLGDGRMLPWRCGTDPALRASCPPLALV